MRTLAFVLALMLAWLAWGESIAQAMDTMPGPQAVALSGTIALVVGLAFVASLPRRRGGRNG